MARSCLPPPFEQPETTHRSHIFEEFMPPPHNAALESLRQLIGQKFDTSPSPFGRWLAPTVINVAEDSLSFGYEVRDDMCNPSGKLHGGVSAAIADDIIGTIAFCSGWAKTYATIYSTIEYFAPAERGQQIVASASIGEKSGRFLSADCRICGEDGKLLIRASSRLLNLSVQRRSLASTNQTVPST